MPPEAHPWLSSNFWSYVPLALLMLVGVIWLLRQLNGWSFAKRILPQTLTDTVIKNEKISSGETGDRMRANATVLPAAKYSKSQINRILEAIDAFYPPLTEIESIMASGIRIASSLEYIGDGGEKDIIGQMDRLRLQIVDPSNRLDHELKTFSLYTEICSVLNENGSQRTAFISALKDLYEIIQTIPDQLSAPAIASFIEAKKTTFIERTASYFMWAQMKKKDLIEYRQWYLRRPTTD